jgi:hypothetical protein
MDNSLNRLLASDNDRREVEMGCYLRAEFGGQGAKEFQACGRIW